MDSTYFELLQLNDATFPIGSYAFSWGLETFVQQGIINNAETAKDYIQSELEGSFLYSELLPVRLAYEIKLGKSNMTLQQLDQIYGASRSPFELREGSRKLATRFVKTTSAFSSSVCWQGYVPQYFPVAYGAYCAERNIPMESVLSAFIYSQVSARVTTSVKLVPLSQSEGQKILFELMHIFSEIIKKNGYLTERDLCRSCPGIDIRAMQHEYLYSRLYSN